MREWTITVRLRNFDCRRGMMSNPGVAAKMFECLYNENVNINMIATSEIRITVLVNSEDAVRAMNAVHDAFGLAEA